MDAQGRFEQLCGAWRVVASIVNSVETSPSDLNHRALFVVGPTAYYPDPVRVYGAISYPTEITSEVYDDSLAALTMMVVFGQSIDRDQRFYIWSGGLLRLSPEPESDAIDIIPHHGEPLVGFMSQGIYCCEGNRFTLCAAKADRAPRPTSFDDRGPDNVLEIMERVCVGDGTVN